MRERTERVWVLAAAAAPKKEGGTESHGAFSYLLGLRPRPSYYEDLMIKHLAEGLWLVPVTWVLRVMITYQEGGNRRGPRELCPPPPPFDSWGIEVEEEIG